MPRSNLPRLREAFGERHELFAPARPRWAGATAVCLQPGRVRHDLALHRTQVDGQFDRPLPRGAVPRVHERREGHAPRRLLGAGERVDVPARRDHDTLHRQPRHRALGHGGLLPRTDGAHPTWVPGNKGTTSRRHPTRSRTRHRLALAWLLGQPGAPLLYYGDEYAEWGGADPNNRAPWRGASALTGEEAATLAFTKKLGKARQELAALRRGAYKHVFATEEVLVFARQDGANVALVALNRVGAPRMVVAPLRRRSARSRADLHGPHLRREGRGTERRLDDHARRLGRCGVGP